MLNKTFFAFFLGFVAIIGVSFGILVVTGLFQDINAADNVAQPR